MALARQSLNELKRTLKIYDDVICMFFVSEEAPSLKETINSQIEQILSSTYKMTDSLIKMVKIELGHGAIPPKVKAKFGLSQNHFPTICYFKNGKIVARRYNTFSKNTLDQWISLYFYGEEN